MAGEESLKALTSALPGVAFIIEDSGRYVEILGSDSEALYRQESDLRGSTLQETFEPELASYFLDVIRETLDTGELQICEYLLDVQKGRRWFEARVTPVETPVGEPRRALWLAHDITDRKEANERRRLLEAKLHAVIERSEDQIVAYDRDGQVLFINEAQRRLFRQTLQAEVDVGTQVIDLIPAHLRDYWSALTERALAGEFFTEMHKFQTPDGTRYFESSWTPIIISDRVTGFATISRDVTPRRQLEERLHQVEKMNAVGQLAGGVAHDFNNQIMCIMGYASVLQSTVTEKMARRGVEMILQAAHRSARLTSQLLAFARRGQYQEVAVNLHDLIGEVTDLLSHSIDKRIQIRARLDADVPVAIGDPTQLQNVLLNIALNARDAMPEGGELVFETDIIQLAADRAASLPFELEAGPYLRVRVIDTGVGMSEEVRRRIFEPFFTTKPTGKGTGMGLASVYGTVKNHGGAVVVKSREGVGSTFEVLLPQGRGVAMAEGTGQPMTSKPDKSSGRILVVEDDRAVASVMTEYLEAIGHEVQVCYDGVEAVATYEKDWDNIDLVVLDLMMPRMNGEDAFACMSEINPEVQVVAVSGYSMESVARNLLKQPGLTFIQKPFELPVLRTAVAERLNEIRSPQSELSPRR